MTPIALEIPTLGSEIAVDLAIGTVTGTVATRRELGRGLWQLVVRLPDGGAEVLIVQRADDGGWCAVESQSIGRALAIARRVKGGQTLHGSVNQAFNELADAVLALAGVSPQAS